MMKRNAPVSSNKKQSSDDSKTISIVSNRRHELLKEKESIYRLVAESYAGGLLYQLGNHLHKYPRENQTTYDARKERAVFLNHVQPLADFLVGLLLTEDTTREVPSILDPFIAKTSLNKDITLFMQDVILNSLLHTVAVLVDSPSFDRDQVKTKAAETESKLSPYAVIYYPWQIRDYHIDDDGELAWIILDITKPDKTNPLVAPKTTKIYRLWTREQFQDFDITNNKIGEAKDHPCGRVPVILVSWKDLDGDGISDLPFEDIAIMDKAIYNLISFMEEGLASSSFKILFYPAQNVKTDIPNAVIKGGLHRLAVVPYNGTVGKPVFSGPAMDGVDPFLKVIEFYVKEIKAKLGLGDDENRSAPQSGEAKRREFKKTIALLKNAARVMENFETRMFEIALSWYGKKVDKIPAGKKPKKGEPTINVVYNKNFDPADIKESLEELDFVASIPVPIVQKEAWKKIIRLVFADADDSLIKELVDSVEAKKPDKGTKDDFDDDDADMSISAAEAEKEAKAANKKPAPSLGKDGAAQ